MQRMVRASLAAASAAAMCVSSGAVGAQDGDDWEFTSNPERQMTAAVVRYEGGRGIIVQCLGEELKVVLTGLPATTAAARRFEATRADGRTDTSVWKVQGPLAISDAQSARDARFLRAGGELRLRSPSGEPAPISASFDLPTQHANLDRVITACAYPLENDRDAFQRADPALRLVRALQEDETAGTSGRSLERSCLIQDGAYQNCRADHWPQGYSERSPARQVQGLNGRRIHADDAAANEGRVVYVNQVLLMVYRN